MSLKKSFKGERTKQASSLNGRLFPDLTYQTSKSSDKVYFLYSYYFLFLYLANNRLSN